MQVGCDFALSESTQYVIFHSPRITKSDADDIIFARNAAVNRLEQLLPGIREVCAWSSAVMQL